MNQNLERTPMFDGLSFGKRNASTMERLSRVTGRDLRCIDDRDDRSGMELPPYAVPGAALGVVMDVMAAAFQAAAVQTDAIKGASLNAQRLFDAGMLVMDGVMTFHTDSAPGRDLPCGGCGYCAASLKNPASNFFSDTAATYFKYNALGLCEKSMQEAGLSVPTYQGPHVAKAVMVVDSDTINLPSTGSEGDHVYVLHQSVRRDLLEQVGAEMYPIVAEVAADLSEDDWQVMIGQLAEKRLGEVVKALGADKLPMFVVSNNGGEISVSQIETQAEAEESETSVAA